MVKGMGLGQLAIVLALWMGAGIALAGEEPGFESGPVPAWVTEQAVAERWPDDAPGAAGANWRIWLLDAQVDRRGDTVLSYFDQVFEARTQELVGEAARFSVGFNPGYQSLTIHAVQVRREGRWLDRYDPGRVTLARREAAFESDMATGVVSALIVVDDVRPGDLVRYRYSVAGENPVLAGMTHDEFRMSWHDPILHRHVRVLMPPGIQADVRPFGIEVEPAIRRQRDGVEVVVALSKVPVVQTASDLPPWYDPYGSLQIAPRREWSDVVRWARPLYPVDQALPEELLALIEQWRQLPDPQARVAAALQRVQDEVRYFSVLLGESTHRPAQPSTTWQRRFGDCKDKAWLLAELLRRLDIEAVPALVSMSNNRRVADGIPAASQFDHVIVRAEVAGETYWLDPTLSQQRGPLAQRSAYDFGLALPIVGDSVALQPVGSRPAAAWRNRVRERFEPSTDGRHVELVVETLRAGRAAEMMRRELDRQGLAEIARGYADHYRRLYGDLEVAETMQVRHDPDDGSVLLRERYLLSAPWEPSAAGRRVIDLFADGLDGQLELPGTLDRRHPLARRHPVALEQLTEFVLPEGWRLDSAPATQQAQDATFTYRREVAQALGRLSVRHVYESKADHVPVADVADHVGQRRQANAALGYRLNLVMPSGGGKGDRQSRMRNLVNDLIQGERGGDE